MDITPLLHKVMDRRALTRTESHEAFSAIMRGDVTPVQLAAFLAALRVKGESVEEITGAAEAVTASFFAFEYLNKTEVVFE